MSILNNDWSVMLEEEFQKPYYLALEHFLQQEYETQTIYPAKHELFNALQYTAYADIKVVILGQDPYHGPEQAHGLSFSVQPGAAVPPSLRNIYKELNYDLGCPIPSHGHLEKWAKQGVLLLNTVLSVRAHQAHSHKGKGWEVFTNALIQKLNARSQPIVFMLWGNPAQKKAELITEQHHCIIKSAHPSPLSASRGFFGSRPFSKANSFLRSTGQQEIDWKIEAKTN
jgi:uracil-DNA glycosylase